VTRWLLLVEYAGERFQGWQSQPHRATVADHLAAALAQVAGHPVALTCAGRTDAGVHALAQVVHFDTVAKRPATAWVRGANAHLPAGITVWHAQPVDGTFHARFSARSRCYRYLLSLSPHRPAAWLGKVGWFHRPLDLAAMRQATHYLLGTHDFSAFRAAQCQAKQPVRTMIAASVNELPGGVAFDFEADGFLHHMVRNLVGTLVYIGKGFAPPEWVGELLAARDRRRAPPTFMADGLYFCGADYGDNPMLPGGGRIVRLPEVAMVTGAFAQYPEKEHARC
jgi:tRNA pseudouridine38-40 synthase